MSTLEWLSIALLVAVFVLAIWRDVNVGLAALPAAFLLAGIGGIPKQEVLAGFPADIVVLIIGVMYMFGHAQRSGAVDRVVHAVVRASGGRDWLLPWGMFLIGAVLSAIGTLPSATVAIVLPVSMRLARSRGIDPVLIALVACSGAGVGGFSPLAPWAKIVETLSTRQHVDYSPAGLFLGLAGLKTAVTIVAFFALGGMKLIRTKHAAGSAAGPRTEVPELRGAAPMSRYEIGSLIGLGVFLVGALALGVNVAFLALAVGLVLHLVFRPDTRKVVGELPWGVVLIIAGVLVYVADLERIGTLTTIAGHLGGIDNTLLAILAISYLASFFATIESSTVAVLSVVVPLVVAAMPHHGPAGFTALLIAVCGTIGAVAISPLHLGGGLVLANTEEKDQRRVFRWTLGWSLGAAIILPAVLLLVPLTVGV
ncbi:SLC13 family permease [Actinomadura macrotermitis]|uniref:Dicarboxylate carrier MatC N-terminal domain-containing protein n=1 Tax=Actinomadura macrotermitis TaxID=2585200 RepID=A0A7K0C0K4_9ACTN|nr:SLC13 family permease [Actinomadura macrotermitis]MQY06969.1 hypothetical protein [Actinomadura macrotermitis]